MDKQSPSYLIADLGSAYTRAALIEPVSGEYRALALGQATSTLDPPWSDPLLALKEAIAQIQTSRHKTLLSEESGLIPREAGGVDSFVATASAAPPLRTVTLGLAQDYSLKIARRIVVSTYAQTIQSIDARRLRLNHGEGARSLLTALSRGEVDVLILSGGTDQGDPRPVVDLARDLAAILQALPGGHRFPILYLGNREARPQIAQILGPLTTLHLVNNPLPSLNGEFPWAAQEALEKIWVEEKLLPLPGLPELSSWAEGHLHPTLRGLAWALDYLAQRHSLRLLGVDIGASSAGAILTQGEKPPQMCTENLGLGRGIANLLPQVEAEKISRWLPFPASEGEIKEWVLNKSLHPYSLPQTRRELLLEQAVARETISAIVGEIFPSDSKGYPDMVVGRGALLSTAPNPRQAALILLDALQPPGVVTLALDRYGILPSLGALAHKDPQAATQVLERDGLLVLGTAVSLLGRGSEGNTALGFKVTYETGKRLEGEVSYGSLEVLPLAKGQRATVELHPSRGFDVGLGRRGKAAVLADIEGGEVGLIIDARGRPLPWPSDPEKSRLKEQEWMQEIGF